MIRVYFFMVCMLVLGIATGYYVGRRQRVVCMEELAGFQDLQTMPGSGPVDIGIWSICGTTPVIILD